MSLGSVRLADVSFHAVSYDGPSDDSRYGYSKFSSLPLMSDDIADELRSQRLCTVSVHILILAWTGKTFAAWKLFIARHFRLTTSGLLERIAWSKYPLVNTYLPIRCAMARVVYPRVGLCA